MAEITLEDVLREATTAAVAQVSVALPGTILSFDPITQTATVQLAVNSFLVDPDEEIWVAVSETPITNCPVAFPSGGESSITWPLEAGDSCMVVFADRSIDEWMATNNQTNTPFHRRRFDVSDAMVVPGMRSASNPLDPPTGPGLEIRHKGTEVRVGDGTFAVENSTMELVNTLHELVNALVTSVILTPAGNGSFDASTLLALNTALSDLNSLKE